MTLADYFTLSDQRPARRMPSLRRVAEFWLDRDEWPDYKGNYIGLGEPFCAACGWLAPEVDDEPWTWKSASAHLDRAHLIDRCYGGLDGACNLVPLCHICHKGMPSFRPGQEAEALAWVRRSPDSYDPIWQMVTDEVADTGDNAIGLYMRVMRRVATEQKASA